MDVVNLVGAAYLAFAYVMTVGGIMWVACELLEWLYRKI